MFSFRLTSDKLFQSTLLQEERLRIFQQGIQAFYISIHAPTRGATVAIYSIAGNWEYFNPRSYKRSDSKAKALTLGAHVFQSTLLQEERQFNVPSFGIFTNFNPRSYKRSDILILPCLPSGTISIHAPTRGAT